MSVADTEDLISILDDDVTELDVLVSMLQEENSQLQEIVNFLLQRVADLEASDTITNNTLDGIILLISLKLVQVNIIIVITCFCNGFMCIVLLHCSVLFAGINIQLNDVDERLHSVEDEVDELDDEITALEVTNMEITDRLTTVEEIISGKFWLKNWLSNCLNFHSIVSGWLTVLFQSRGWPAWVPHVRTEVPV